MVTESGLSQWSGSCNLMVNSETDYLETKLGILQREVFHSDDIIIGRI
jgi:hypothetical protein